MAVKIIIPGRTHEEFGFSISKLIRVVDNFSRVHDNKIIFDFSNARMLNPFFLGGLACLIDYYKSKNIDFELNHDQNLNVASYLQTVRFPECYNANENNWSLEEFSDKRYIPIVRFPTGASSRMENIRNAILSAISDLLKKQLGFTERQRAPLSYMLDEFTHNVNDHSGAQEGFVFAQYYPSSNYLDLCICDHGKGVYQSYLDSGKHDPRDEIGAIKMAINGISTKDLPESKGFGITTSRKMLTTGLRGKFYLWSGNTAYIESVERLGIVNLPKNCFFQGTYIALRIPTLMPPGFNITDFLE